MANGSSSNDSVSHYLKLYELQKDCFDKRRVTVWTVSISFWTAIMVSTGFLLQKFQIPSSLWWFYVLTFCAFCFGWLLRVWYADQKDHGWMHVYRSLAEVGLGYKKIAEDFKQPSRWYFLIEEFTLAQVIITGLLLLASWYLLSSVPVQVPKL